MLPVEGVRYLPNPFKLGRRHGETNLTGQIAEQVVVSDALGGFKKIWEITRKLNQAVRRQNG